MSRFDTSLYERAMRALGRQPEAAVDPVDVTAEAIDTALELIRHFEGFYSVPYLCPAGVPTIGYGATHYPDGRRVKLNDPAISRDTAERMLMKTVRQDYLPTVIRLCPGVTNPRRLAALIDFTFNLGGSALASSTLRRRVLAGEWDLVPTELRKWVYAGGRRLDGLKLRREAEAQLI